MLSLKPSGVEITCHACNLDLDAMIIYELDLHSCSEIKASRPDWPKPMRPRPVLWLVGLCLTEFLGFGLGLGVVIGLALSGFGLGLGLGLGLAIFWRH